MRERWKRGDEGGSVREGFEVVVGYEDGVNHPDREGGGVFSQGVDETEAGYGIEGLVLVWFGC